jgi:nitrogen fixation protein NifB
MHTITDEIKYHPCCSSSAHFKYGRIHLPVAPRCNMECNYCNRKVSACYHTYRPSLSKKIITPEDALKLVSKYSHKNWLKVAGIAGPGEPLYNEETFETFALIHKFHPEIALCVCTNGLLLPKYIEKLCENRICTITITVNTVEPEIAKKIYSHIIYDGKKITGLGGMNILIQNQLDGIKKAANSGIFVKVNTVFIPEINATHIVEVARKIRSCGAHLQNIIPLIPFSKFRNFRKPSYDELTVCRDMCEYIIPQFRLCKQCRSDSVGIPAFEKQFC